MEPIKAKIISSGKQALINIFEMIWRKIYQDYNYFANLKKLLRRLSTLSIKYCFFAIWSFRFVAVQALQVRDKC